MRPTNLFLALVLGGCSGTVVGDAATPTDATATDAPGADAAACGPTPCATGELCVHTVMTGGACRPVGDAGTCGPGERLAGTCCTAFSESYRCAARPSGCDPTVTCGCATTLCMPAAGGGCPCQSAAGSNVECACLFP